MLIITNKTFVQDSKEISSIELADTFAQMHEKKRYNELMFVIDTCHAVSMYTKFYSPNIVSMASSQADEDSLSHHVDEEVGVFIIDRLVLFNFLLTFKITFIGSFFDKLYENSYRCCF